MDDDVPGPGAAAGEGRRKAMTANTDPRAVRTREKLISAFHQAIRDSEPRDMSVSALARAAGVNRTSFYEHFASPEDLAIHALSELLDVVSNADIAMRAQHAVTGAEASRRALHQIVSFVAAQRDSYARVLGPGAAPRLLPGGAEPSPERTVRPLEPMDVPPPEADPRITARFLAGGVLGVIGAWLAEPGPGPPLGPGSEVEALIPCLPGWGL